MVDCNCDDMYDAGCESGWKLAMEDVMSYQYIFDYIEEHLRSTPIADMGTKDAEMLQDFMAFREMIEVKFQW